MIRFHVPAVPVAQPRQRHRALTINGRTITQNYTPEKHPVQTFKGYVRLALISAYTGAPLEGPVAMRIVFIMPRPKSMLWKSKPMPRAAHIAKPDSDNLVKACKDALSKFAWRDDAQVCRMTVEKWIAAGHEQPGVDIEIAAMAAGEGA